MRRKTKMSLSLLIKMLMLIWFPLCGAVAGVAGAIWIHDKLLPNDHRLNVIMLFVFYFFMGEWVGRKIERSKNEEKNRL